LHVISVIFQQLFFCNWLVFSGAAHVMKCSLLYLGSNQNLSAGRGVSFLTGVNLLFGKFSGSNFFSRDLWGLNFFRGYLGWGRLISHNK